MNVRKWIEISRSSPAEIFRPPLPHKRGIMTLLFFILFFLFSFFIPFILFFFAHHIFHPFSRRPGHILSSGYYSREEGAVDEGFWMRCRDSKAEIENSIHLQRNDFYGRQKLSFQTHVNCCPGDYKLIKHKLILFGLFFLVKE